MRSRHRSHFRHSRVPRPQGVPRPCPSWCKIDHGAEIDEDGIRMHAQDSLARVSVWVTENLATGEWSPEITVSGVRNLGTAEQVRELVFELLAAADLLEEGAQ